MKKTNIWVIGAVIIIILIAVFVWSKHSSAPTSPAAISPEAAAAAAAGNNAPTTSSAPVVQIATTTGALSTYQNAELGFSVKYPTTWTLAENPSGPTFTIPVNAKTTTISSLSSSIYIAAGKCAFPPVAPSSIKENTTVKAGGFTFSMISVKSTANSLNYFDRMYTLEQGTAAHPLCYLFSFAAVTKTTNANNQPVITAADNAFSAMVKTFAVLTGPTGDSETAHAAGK